MIRALNRRSVLFITVALILSVSMPPLSVLSVEAQEKHLEIEKIWSTEVYYTWVGTASNSITDLFVTVNGQSLKSEEYVLKDYEGTIHIRLPLEYNSSNMIDIREGNNVLFQADVFYAPAFESQLASEDYLSDPFHTEENEKSCISCHRLEINNEDLISKDNTTHICYPCHKHKFSGRTFQHYAAGLKWECLRCHQTKPMESEYSFDVPVKFSIKEGMEVAPLCYQCHINREKEFSEYEYLHGPIGMKLCIMCHNPHGSNTAKMLQKELVTLCVDCHKLQDMLRQHNVHYPISMDGCLSCHDPHGSNFPFFLNKEVNGVCVGCHDSIKKLENNHPIMGHPVSGETDPINTDEKFSCISCHDPHSSEFDFLLADDEIMMTCMRCHNNATR
jgi:predicted CXXCH cytochrome family protein